MWIKTHQAKPLQCAQARKTRNCPEVGANLLAIEEYEAVARTHVHGCNSGEIGLRTDRIGGFGEAIERVVGVGPFTAFEGGDRFQQAVHFL